MKSCNKSNQRPAKSNIHLNLTLDLCLVITHIAQSLSCALHLSFDFSPSQVLRCHPAYRLSPLTPSLLHFTLQASISNMKSACLSLLLVSVCWALPFRQSGFMDFMMEDEPGSGSPMPPVRKPPVQTPPPMLPDGPDGPFCPFRCQCHLRVAQCSDLGNDFMTLD